MSLFTSKNEKKCMEFEKFLSDNKSIFEDIGFTCQKIEGKFGFTIANDQIVVFATASPFVEDNVEIEFRGFNIVGDHMLTLDDLGGLSPEQVYKTILPKLQPVIAVYQPSLLDGIPNVHCAQIYNSKVVLDGAMIEILADVIDSTETMRMCIEDCIGR